MSEKNEHGFSIFELIIVMSIFGIVYAIAVPNFTFLPETRITENLATLSADVRSAFDYAVLKNRPHRIVLNMGTTEYWIEELSEGRFLLPDDQDPSSKRQDALDMSEEELKLQFEERMEGYLELNGEEFSIADSDDKIPPKSPLSEAKDRLAPPVWSKLSNAEFEKDRRIDEDFLIRNIKTENFPDERTIEDKLENPIVYLYFFPSGYAERAIIQLSFWKSEGVIDEERKPYTLITRPYSGTLDVRSGVVDMTLEDVGGEDDDS